jgi:4-oxalomesaconate hydratase
VDLTFGERGESEDFWAHRTNRSLEEAKAARAQEASEAAAILGVTIEFMDYGDYPLAIDARRLEELAHLIRKNKPGAILTHWKSDPFNVDHEVTAAAVVRAAAIAAVPGFEPDDVPQLFPQLFGFEPTVPRDDEAGFVPDTYVDIGEVFETKLHALQALRCQQKLPGSYTLWAQYRAVQATQWSGRPIRYAEAFKRCTAFVSDQLPLID